MVAQAGFGFPSKMSKSSGADWGDCLSMPLPVDAEALDPIRLRRWGPQGADAYHLVVLPRPHQAAWLARAAQQVALEAGGSTISVCCIVDRALCPEQWAQKPSAKHCLVLPRY